MSSKKCLIISILLAFSLILFTGCLDKTPHEIPALAKQGEGADENSVTVYVLTKYELTEVVVEYGNYSSWTELIEGEFDGRNSARKEANWRGSYIISIGNLRPEDPAGIVIYLNGIYSSYFVEGCDYQPGYTLAFVEPGANI